MLRSVDKSKYDFAELDANIVVPDDTQFDKSPDQIILEETDSEETQEEPDSEEIIPEQGSEEIIPEQDADEIIPEQDADEIIPEQDADELRQIKELGGNAIDVDAPNAHAPPHYADLKGEPLRDDSAINAAPHRQVQRSPLRRGEIRNLSQFVNLTSEDVDKLEKILDSVRRSNHRIDLVEEEYIPGLITVNLKGWCIHSHYYR